ncbi:nitronate monooxygenase [Corynebacterium sp. 320]|uniref:NAD(P)H-dependent flavin oxidoreductase n=1 Tax=Corynebacterium TaxID=1716 RepID=UPI00125CBACE|nr:MULTISPECIES: nitronate monooxygenase [Corynebacterium]KAB1502718.1 nitronate monooxygenase [Corynebacterium sp. 320]KAB1550544.1 nitronate monooxygenase [Corynebacterium sp. 319]KAB1554729.1 nitronate monooxygenase [Corynebacterium sp. 321]KAB3526381.1 nitronate monooxygenase [Corynebacterium sp. 250]KAB3537774.1 nitronate monooxygenase [Corynebacterium sp. 366]
MSSFTTRLTKLWGIDKPIVSAPMAGRAGGELARAVSLAGGLGTFGVSASASPEWITEQAAIARQGGVYGIGLMLWAMEKNPELGEQQWKAVLDARPSVVSLGFGDSTRYVEEAHDHGISVVQPVNTIAQLRTALAAEADAITVQGTDAGGHTGRLGTTPWMQIALDYMEIHAPAIPVAVAGGIGSGRGVASVLAAGADAAWVGTAFLASPECLGGEELQKASVNARSTDAVLTDIYDIAEQQAWDTETWPTRTIRNSFVDAYAELRERGEVSDDELIAARAPGGDYADELKLHAGQGVSLLRSRMPAGKVVDMLHDDAMHFLERMRTRLG